MLIGLVNTIMSSPQKTALCLLAASLGALASAFTFQYGLGMEPCILCIYQRWPYAITAVLALILLKTPRPAATWVLALCAAVYLAGGVIAFYHTGVEQKWWVSFLEGCHVPQFNAMSPEDILRQIEATPVVPCDKIPWQMFGISMAGYNVMMSVGLALFCGMAALRVRKS